MPRKLTIECVCDRCGRIWYVPYVEGKEPSAAPTLELKFVSGETPRTVCYEALCDTCVKAVLNYVDKLGALKHKSPDKYAAKKESVRPTPPIKLEKPEQEKKPTPRVRPASSSPVSAQST